MKRKRNYKLSVLLLICLCLAATIIWVTRQMEMQASSRTILSKCNVYCVIRLDNRTIKPLSLHQTERQSTSEEMLVPNVIHFVWFGDPWSFTFLNYLSFLSVHKVLSPEYIFIHGENIPNGYWWNQTIQNVSNIYHVYRQAPPTALNGQPFKFKEHRSDLARLQIIISYGGIYLDKDMIVLKSFNQLRKYQTVLGRETKHALSNSVILGQKEAPFLKILNLTYYAYNGPNETWTGTSLQVPHSISRILPTMVHVEEDTFNRPLWNELKIYFHGSYNWSRLYATHVWARKAKQAGFVLPKSPDDIRHWNGSFGEITRFIYYGPKDVV